MARQHIGNAGTNGFAGQERGGVRTNPELNFAEAGKLFAINA